MTVDQFYDEVKKSNNCPDNFDTIFEEFKKYQDDAIRTLKEFHRICEKNGIRYILGYGSLLGAVRDNGVIPWDYDVDVFVPYEEIDNLLRALNSDLSSDFYYQCPANSSKFPSFMIRISPNEYDTLAIHVDIFYIIGASSDENERYRFGEKIKKLCLDRTKKLYEFKNSENRSWKALFLFYAAKIRRWGISIKEIDRQLTEICEHFDPKRTNQSMIVCSVYDKVFTYPTDLLWDTKLITTDYGIFRIPKTYNEVLYKLYGEYHITFPLNKRLNEMMHYYKLLKHLDSVYKLGNNNERRVKTK